MKTKETLRLKALQSRNEIPPEKRSEKSRIILEKLEKHPIFQSAKHVLFYYTHGSEVNTLPLIKKSLENKKIYLPKLINKNKFIALPVKNLNELKKGRFGIPEPEEGGDDAGILDLIIVPGVAFDQNGNRLGMGEGFYDRFLEQIPKTPTIALAFAEQMLDHVPKESYDKPVDLIITDEGIYNTSYLISSI